MNAEFKRRRDVFVAGLNKIKGFSCRLPKGAFYVFPNITKTGWPSKKLADALLEQAGVACLSGTAFGAYGEGYLRFSVANSLENLNKALSRIEAWVGQRTCNIDRRSAEFAEKGIDFLCALCVLCGKDFCPHQSAIRRSSRVDNPFRDLV